MNLRDLQYVIALAEHKNFTRAAEAASVSQPALSNQIKKLETELGVPIFQRGRGNVELTAFGQDIIGNAKQIMGLVENIGDLAQQHGTSRVSPLRLGVTPTLAAYLLRYFRELFEQIAADRMIVFVEDYPSRLVKMIEDKSLDMAFIAKKSFVTLRKGSDSLLEFTSLWFETLYLGVRQGHALAQKKSIWAFEVPADQLIRFDVSFGYDLEQDLPKSSDKVTGSTGIDVKSARFETVCRHVAQSDACTLVNAIAAEQFKQDSFGLDFIPFNDEGNMRELGVVTHAQFPHPEFVAAMHDGICHAAPRGTVASCSKSIVDMAVGATR